jgi:hypothetical protein
MASRPVLNGSVESTRATALPDAGGLSPAKFLDDKPRGNFVAAGLA